MTKPGAEAIVTMIINYQTWPEVEQRKGKSESEVSEQFGFYLKAKY